jgi:hypothetical protein
MMLADILWTLAGVALGVVILIAIIAALLVSGGDPASPLHALAYVDDNSDRIAGDVPF